METSPDRTRSPRRAALGGGVLLLAGLALVGSEESAQAGGKDRIPATCQAVFMGPTKHCSWTETLSAAGTASSTEKAGKLATERLLSGAQGLADARALQTAGTMAAVRAEPERDACPAAVAETLRLSCFPDLELGQPLTCFADFPDETCWDPHMVIQEGTGWKVMESVRDQLCTEVAAGLRRSELSPAEQAGCLARCTLEGRVRCPGLASSP